MLSSPACLNAALPKTPAAAIIEVWTIAVWRTCSNRHLWSAGYVRKSIQHYITTTAKSREDGFVLIAVIWIAGLLAITATAFLSLTTSHIFLARNVAESQVLDGAASGMASLVSYQLAQSNAAQPAPEWKRCL
jgi:hypothetical protein